MKITRFGLFVLVAVLATACGKGTGGNGTAKAPDGKANASNASSTPSSDAKKTAAKSTTSAAKGVASAAPAPKLELPKGPIGKVNGTEISSDEFAKKYGKMTKAFTTRKKEIPEGLAKRYKQSIMKQLVDKELLAQEVGKSKITIEGAELDKEFAEYKKMFRTDENFQRYLKSSEITEDAIKGNIKHNLAVSKLLEKTGGLKVDEAAIKGYFDKNKARYEIKEQVRASHILFKVPAKAEKAKDDAAKAKATKAHKAASKKGADFAELAKKLSEGPTGPRGGDLSYFTKGRMVPAFEKVAFGMKVGDVSEPLRTQFGWHVIKVTDRKEGRQRPFAEVKDSIGKLLRNKNSRKAKAELLKKLKTSAKIEIFLPGVDLNAPLTPPKRIAPKVAPKIVPKTKPANK